MDMKNINAMDWLFLFLGHELPVLHTVRLLKYGNDMYKCNGLAVAFPWP